MTLRPTPAAATTESVPLPAALQCVLFDFDGPLADLFAALPAPEVAALLCDRVASWSAAARPRLTAPDDPLRVLLDVARAYRDRPEYGYRVAELDKLLAEQEVRAAAGARPAGHCADLVGALLRRGVTLAVTTNNSPAAVLAHLARHGLRGAFAGGVHGRTGDPLRMKPDPAYLHAALRAAGAAPQRSLMIGDSPGDCAAAHAAGVPFLGYATTADKRRLLRQAGATVLVASLAEVTTAVEAVEAVELTEAVESAGAAGGA